MAALRMAATSTSRPFAGSSSPSSPPPLAESATVTSAGGAAAPTSAAASVGAAPASTASGAASGERTVTLRITSDPAGAAIREDSVEVCAATPCDLTFKGDAADPAKTHKLLFLHLGYRPELKIVTASDPPLHVKLLRGGGGTFRPVTTAKPASSDAAPNGFKDLPY
jgi:serine/threonine-protein kinase